MTTAPIRDDVFEKVRACVADSLALNAADLKLEKMEALLGDPETLDAIRTGRALGGIRTVRDRLVPEFLKRRQPHLLY